MTTTLRVSNITAASWTELASGSANVTVDFDHKHAEGVRIRVETSAPGSEVVDGFELTKSRRTFPIAGLGSTDKVYARSMSGTVSVVVAKS